jgi:hypothetical protein
MMRAALAVLLPSLLLLQAPPEPVDPTTGKKAGPRARGPLELDLGPATAIDVSKETPGQEPRAFLPIVGDWSVVEDGGQRVVRVDGRKWKRGQPSNGLVEKARTLYGKDEQRFLDNVKAFAYFPYALAQGVEDFHEGELRVRFQVGGGDLDQCAGLVFNVKPNGDYLAWRFNGKEDNAVLWTFFEGQRHFVARGTTDKAIPLGEWHELLVKVKGNRLEGWLDDTLQLQYSLPFTISGKVGLWSKTDSVASFDAFTVRPLKPAPPSPAPGDAPKTRP